MGQSPNSKGILIMTKNMRILTMRSAVEQTQACLDRIDARDEQVRAWAYLDHDGALAQARAVDEAGADLPLRGVPVGIKDIIETGDQPTAYGSVIWEAHRPEGDAQAVRRLRMAGAVILGKTTTTEFATYNPTETRNPYNKGHSPGGSSSGSAAATGDGQVPLALGTQTAGSVTRPGSFCGVFTFKPTYSRWPLAGVLPVALTFDTLGGFARNPELLLALDVVLASPRADGSPARTKPLPLAVDLRVGVLRLPWSERAQPEALVALKATADRLAACVGRVEVVDVPEWVTDLQAAHADIQNYEAASALQPMIAPDPTRISELLQEHLANGRALSSDRVEAARDVLRRVTLYFDGLLREYDVLLTLAAPGEAPESLATTGDPAYNRPASTAGLPALGFPIGMGPPGLPLGAQLIGPADSDEALLGLLIKLFRDSDVVLLADLPN